MVRLGIIGCGRVVEEGHVPALAGLGERVAVVALADPSAERRDAVAAALGGRPPAGYADWRKLLEAGGVDAVTVAVPHDLHERAIVDAAAAGVDVISEKPLATTLEEVDRIGEALAAAGVRLSVMHNWRCNEHIAATIRAIAAGRIGEVYLARNESIVGATWRSKDPNAPDWRDQPARSGGGIVLDAVYHAVYLAEDQARSPVEAVFAATQRAGAFTAVEDTAVIVFRHASGATTCVERSCAAAGGGAGVQEIHGSEGSIRIRQPDPRALALVFRGEYEALARLPLPADGAAPVEIFEAARGSWEPLDGIREAGPWWQGMREVFARTFAAWEGGGEAPAGLEEARHTLAVIRAAYLSAERGEVVRVAELEDAGRGSVLAGAPTARREA
jgi:predicted dehydrogenase